MDDKLLIRLISLSLIFFQLAFAQIPQTLGYQGLLTDSTGNTVPDGQYQLFLSLFDQENGGQAIYDEAQHVFTVNGVFEVVIGNVIPIPLAFDRPYWLEVELDGEVHSPRTELTSVAYSFNTANIPDSIVTAEKIADGQVVRTLNGLTDAVTISAGTNVTITPQGNDVVISATGGGDSLWTTYGNNITYQGGKVGIGATNPIEALDVRGNIRLPATSANGDSGVITLGTGLNSRFSIHNYGPGNDNLFIGNNAGNFTLTGRDNVGIGRSVLGLASSAFNSTGIGHLALEKTTLGDDNTAVGYSALADNTVGSDNTAVGAATLDQNTSGNNNVAIGNGALGSNISGDDNTAIGSTALSGNLNGSGLTAIGAGAGVSVDNLVNATAIGRGAKVDASNKIRLGNNDVILVETAGTVEAQSFKGTKLLISNSGPGAAVEVSGNASSGQLLHAELLVPPGTGQDMLQIQSAIFNGEPFEYVEFENDGDVKFRISHSGNVFADGSYTGPADFAEMLKVSNGAAAVEAGDVLVIDPEKNESIGKSTTARSSLVAGIYSTKPGFVGSERNWDKPAGEETTSYTMTDMASEFNEIPMAVIGIVPCKVSAENGAIRPGDLLVTASIPGHAMRDETPVNGTIVGKALGELTNGTGIIKVLVTLQ